MFSNLDLIALIIVLLLCQPLFLFIFMVPIGLASLSRNG